MGKGCSPSQLGEANSLLTDVVKDYGGVAPEVGAATIWDPVAYPYSAPSISSIHGRVGHPKGCSRYIGMVSGMDWTS